MILVDTEFLFGLRKDDPHYSECRTILEKVPNQLIVPGFAIMEIVLVMMSQQKEISTIRRFLETLLSIIKQNNIKEKKIRLAEIIKGLEILESYPNKTFFDALIIGSALLTDQEILGNDPAFSNIPQLRQRKLKDFLRWLGEEN
ncbi:MAG: type II toxin-antitoxin system VapC family toxin [Candidatus Hodarchaeales archaeon]|jgi:PIN domain nuclease of toxin-antitoxin system